MLLVEEQVDGASGAERVVGHRARRLDCQLVVGLRQLSEDARRRPIEQQRDVAARRVVHLPQHEAARLCRRLPVHAAQRLTRVVRPDAAELDAPSVTGPRRPCSPRAPMSGEQARRSRGGPGADRR